MSGVGAGDITGTIAAWACSPGECAGFSGAFLVNMIWSFQPGVGLDGYDFTSNLGPVDLLSPSIQTSPIYATTAAGNLIFTDASQYFIMEVTLDPVPEPASWLLFSSGALALLLARRRKA